MPYIISLHAKVLFLTIYGLKLVSAHSRETEYPFNEAIRNYTKFFSVENEVKIMHEYSQNITFNSTQEKFIFIFYPLMEKCVDEIKEEYEALMDSVGKGGAGAATYGVLVATNVAIKVGLWKTGIASLIKTAALSTFSLGALPIVAGVGAAAYLYNSYQEQEIKENCRLAMKNIDYLINDEELEKLEEIKQNEFKQLEEKGNNLNERIAKMKEFSEISHNYPNNLKKIIAKESMLLKYMKNLTRFI